MAKNDVSDQVLWVGPAIALTLVITAARIALLAFDQKQLFVDEAQYWFWGQHLTFGYFSKPPGIAWLIRAVTELAGSSDPFWVRLPAPVLHGVTAMLLGGVAARLAGGAAAIWTVAAYLTMPLISVGSLLMTTDTLMFPFLVAGYLLWVEAVEDGRARLGALAGLSVGLGFLAKYAAIYFVGAACIAAILIPAMRPGWRVGLWGLAGFVIAISPNILWNVSNGLITVQHTVDNVDWARDPSERLGLEWHKLGEFVGAQFMVMGPLLLPALVWAGLRWRNLRPGMRALIVFSLPIILLVCVQALLSRAYANWAAAAYLSGSVAAVVWLLPRSRLWLAGAVAVNVVIGVLIGTIVTGIPLLPEKTREAAMQRYLGRIEMTEAVVDIARQQGIGTVVAGNRDILADLFYNGRDSGITFRSSPPDGRPANHYAMHWAFEGSDGPVLYVGSGAPSCAEGAEPVARLTFDAGYWSRRPQAIWRVPGDCWAQ